MRNRLLRLLSGIIVCFIFLCSLSADLYALDFVGFDGEKTVLREPDADWETIKVSTVQDLNSLAAMCRLDKQSEKIYVELENDISYAGEAFTPIPYFKGIFNGNGHTISGVTCLNTTEPVGLFSTVGTGGIIRNLQVTGALQPYDNCNYIGAIVGENNGIIYKCSFEGVVTGNSYVGGIAGSNAETGYIVNCRVNGAVRGDNMVGGITGINAGSLINCTNNALINTESVDGGIDVANLDLEFTVDIARLLSQTNTSMQDMGGIAGYSNGTIYASVNNGEVGYNHQGYNVGGIVGRSSGHILKCENNAYVCGRKDIGGIVGQMEPYVQVSESESKIHTLDNQIKEMQNLMEVTRNHASDAGEEASRHVDSLLEKLDSAKGNASDISRIITDDDKKGAEETAKEKTDSASQYIKDNLNKDVINKDGINKDDFTGKDDIQKKKDDVSKKQEELDVSLDEVNKELEALNNSAKGYSRELDADLDRISAQYDEIMKTVESLKDISFGVNDTSNINPDLIVLGAVRKCTNEGEVEGDLNAGGIAGVMGEESSFDPEDEISLSIDLETHKDYEYKAVLTNCVNHGYVHTKRNYAGGIVARAEVGFIKEVENYGHVSADGNYAGGVAAESAIKIEKSYAKATISGTKHVGGIVGTGVDNSADGEASLVSDSRALVTIEGASKFYGAISGSPEGDYENNIFTSDTLFGLGAYSADNKAYPVSYEKLMEGNGIPDEFTRLYVQFIADGNVLKKTELKYGESITYDMYPAIPAKKGCFAGWDTDSVEHLEKDTVINAVYTDYIAAVASEDTRMSGRPVFYAEGDFTDTDAITVTKLDNGLLTVNEYDDAHVSNLFYKKEVEEYWHLLLPNDGNDSHTLRYLPTGISSRKPEIFVKESDSFREASVTDFGSYYAFDAQAQDIEIAVVTIMPRYYSFAIAITSGVLAVVALALLITSIVRGAKSRKKKKADLRSGNSENADEEDNTQEKAESDDQESGKAPAGKKSVLRIILRLVNLIFLALVVSLTVYLAKNPEIINERIGYIIAVKMSENNDLSMDVSVLLKADGNEWETSSYVCSVTGGDDKYTYLETGGAELYKHNEMVYLPNGKAFDMTGIIPDYDGVYSILPSLIIGSKITAERVDGGTQRVFWITGNDADRILNAISGSYTSMIASVENAQISIISSNWKVKTLTVKGNIVLSDGQRATLECKMVEHEQAREVVVPDAVINAVSSGAAGAEITPEMLELVYAFGRFNNQDPAVCDIKAGAKGTVISLSNDLTWFRCRENDQWINCVTRNGVSYYYNKNGSCTSKGVLLSDAQKESVNIAELIDITYELLTKGELSVSEAGNETAYKLDLGDDVIEEMLHRMAPEMKDIDKVISSGSITAKVKDGEISDINISISGTVEFVMITKSFTVSANITPSVLKTGFDYAIPEEVINTLARK